MPDLPSPSFTPPPPPSLSLPLPSQSAIERLNESITITEERFIEVCEQLFQLEAHVLRSIKRKIVRGLVLYVYGQLRKF